MNTIFFKATSDKNQKQWPTWVVWALICFFGIWFKFTYHEFWRDEWQAWLVARDLSWSDMFGFLYYEGHPSLWYIYLKICTNFSNGNDVFVLKIAHSLTWAAAIWVLFFRTRFSLGFATLLSLGYFLIFEYGVVVRGYALVLLLALLAASFFEKKSVKNPLLLGLSLFLLCQTEAQGVLIAGVLALYFILITEKESRPSLYKSPALLGFAFGVFTFIYTVFPRGHMEELATARNKGIDLAGAFQGLFSNTFLPGFLPDTRVGGISNMGLLFSVLVLAGLVYFFLERKKLLAAFGISAIVFLGFSSILFLGGIRQWGNFYICFLCLLHLFAISTPNISMVRAGILAVFTLANVQYGMRALHKDFSIPFSNAKGTAEFLKEKVPTNVPIVAIDPFKTAPVGAYADRAFYKLPEGETFTYFHWLRKVYIPPQQEITLFTQFKKVGGVVLISPEPLPLKRYPKAKLWKAFDRNNLKGEHYWVYQIAG